VCGNNGYRDREVSSISIKILTYLIILVNNNEVIGCVLSKVCSPTDAQLDSLKNNFKFALKLTLKGSYMFRCEKHHPQGAHYLSIAEVTVVKVS
jgi:hypothetical protein